MTVQTTGSAKLNRKKIDGEMSDGGESVIFKEKNPFLVLLLSRGARK